MVYDGVGKDTFDGSPGRPAASGHDGPVRWLERTGASPFDLQRLNAGGSLYVTRPSLGHYMAPPEGQQRVDELYGWIADGKLDVAIGARFPMDQAPAAHEALEGRKTTGKVLILP